MGMIILMTTMLIYMQGLRTKFELDLMELQMTGLAKVSSHHQSYDQHQHHHHQHHRQNGHHHNHHD